MLHHAHGGFLSVQLFTIVSAHSLPSLDLQMTAIAHIYTFVADEHIQHLHLICVAIKMGITKWFIIERKCVLRSVYETGRRLSKPLSPVDP